MALKVYLVSLDSVRLVRPLIAVVVREDPDLARQLRRALSSIPLNIAEGESALGRNQRLRFVTALGSAREARACLEVARRRWATCGRRRSRRRWTASIM
jgi:four helix bundle protein